MTAAQRTAFLPLLASAALVASTLVAGHARAGEDDPPEVDAWSDEASWDIPGEYVVDFDDDVSESTVQSVLASHGLSYRETALEDDTRIQIVQAKQGLWARLVAKLRSDDRIEYVEPHAKVEAMFVPNDPMFAEQWHMSRVGAESAWDFAVGRGVTVAVVDTGIACKSFEDFSRATDLATTRCVDGYNFVSKTKHANDDNGHGTHVAGTIAQSTHNGLGVAGLAYRARLMPVKVLSSEGWGTTTAVADGIRWAADHGAHVINLSLGGPRNSRVLQSAVTHALKKGAVVVAAAGNSGSWVGYPGACDGVIGVSATTQADKLAYFSSRGPGVDLAAPGVDVLQQTVCNKGRNGCEIFPTYNGTSMASPHVAGAAALLVSLGVTDADAVEAELRTSARVLDDSDAGRLRFGSGLVQAAAAAERVTLWQGLSRLGALLVLSLLAFGWARRRGGSIRPTHAGFWVAALATSAGIAFFAPWLISRHHVAVDLLSRPLADWDLLLSASLHSYLPFANVIVPIALTVIFYGMKGSRPWLAGVSVGTGAYLIGVLLLGHHAGPFGWLLTPLWVGVNALLCVGLGALLLRREK
ncbi:MAG: S8 family serine peptidase [Deltaproteobacteria bacterium]|jgi:serine protease|nr:S8 family serine peptidase [Deltaproteobacteria bacterium]MBW2536643.1 S8 family serine peptidase [Deltaproteobacteria bacterium]